MTHCPTSKQEQNIAAKRKNCSKLATSQNCTSFEDFVYHCTINSYRNATLEVCAPTRTILGKDIKLFYKSNFELFEACVLSIIMDGVIEKSNCNLV